jgi:hypothetical protein
VHPHPHTNTGEKREITTVYEVVSDSAGAAYLTPEYQFTYGNTEKYAGPKTPSCIPRTTVMPRTYANVTATQTYSYRNGE